MAQPWVRAGILLFFLFLGLLFVGTASAQVSWDVGWHVVAGGGGTSSGGAFALSGTAGQSAVGLAADTSTELCAGFWCGTAVEHRTFLPVIVR